MPVITSSNKGSVVYVDRNRNTATVTRDTRVARVEDARTVQQVVDKPRTLEVSSPGPQGTPGAPGGTSELRIAAAVLGGHRIVRAEPDGRVGYATSDNPAHGDDTVGLTLGAALAGAQVDVQSRGVVAHSGWAWTPGAPVFLGRDGMPTQVAPATGDRFVQVIGFAETATTLHLQIDTPVYLED